jgi:hypothetical protein
VVDAFDLLSAECVLADFRAELVANLRLEPAVDFGFASHAIGAELGEF